MLEKMEDVDEETFCAGDVAITVKRREAKGGVTLNGSFEVNPSQVLSPLPDESLVQIEAGGVPMPNSV